MIGSKVKLTVVSILAVLFVGAGLAISADYSKMSTEELSMLKGTMCNATLEERQAFREEWQKRLAQMTPEERAQYAGPPKNAPCAMNGMGRNRWAGKRYMGQNGCCPCNCMNN